MFDELDATLSKLLNDTSTPQLLRDADTDFRTPDKDWVKDLQRTTINLFLFNVADNRELRDPRPIETRDVITNTVQVRPPPVRINCTYLVTTWSMKVAWERVAEEHRLLALAFGWFSRFPVIPRAYWRFLAESIPAQEMYPPLLGVAQLDPGKDAGEFWIALGIQPRPVFALTATIAMDLGGLTEVPAVTTVHADYSRLGA